MQQQSPPNKTLSLFQYAKLHQPILHLNEEDNLFSKHINIFINNIRTSCTSSRKDSFPVCSQRQTHKLNDIPSTNSKSAINQNHRTQFEGKKKHAVRKAISGIKSITNSVRTHNWFQSQKKKEDTHIRAAL